MVKQVTKQVVRTAKHPVSKTLTFLVIAALLIVSLVLFANPDSGTKLVNSLRSSLTMRTAEAAGIADATADGVADNAEAASLINALPAAGGRLYMLTGTYVWANGVTVTRAIPGVTISGTGVGTYITGDGVTSPFTAGGNNWVLEDLRVQVNTATLLAAMGATTGWEWRNVTTSDGYYPIRAQSGGIGSRSDSYVLAAGNSSTLAKAGADDTGDGTEVNDTQMFVDALALNIPIKVLAGDYYLTNSTVILHYPMEGEGDQLTIFHIVDAAPATSHWGIKIHDGGSFRNAQIICTAGFTGIGLLIEAPDSETIRFQDNVYDNIYLSYWTYSAGSIGCLIHALGTTASPATYIGYDSFGSMMIEGFETGIEIKAEGTVLYSPWINGNNFGPLNLFYQTYPMKVTATAHGAVSNIYESVTIQPRHVAYTPPTTVNGITCTGSINQFNQIMFWDWQYATGTPVVVSGNKNVFKGWIYGYYLASPVDGNIHYTDTGTDNRWDNAAAPYVGQSFDNILPNGSFQHGTTGWTNVNITLTAWKDGDGGALNPGYVKVGTNCLKMVGDGANTYGAARATISNPTHYQNQFITLGGWLYNPTGNASSPFLKVYDDVTGNTSSFAAITKDIWTWETVTAKINAAATTIFVYVSAGAVTNDTYFASGLKLCLGQVCPPSGMPSMLYDDTAYATSWNGVTEVAPSKNAVYDKIASLSGSDIFPTQSFDNLITNGDIEAGKTGWVNANANLDIDTTNVIYGTKSLKVTATANYGSAYLLIGDYTNFLGKTITMGAWVRNDSTGDPPSAMYLGIYEGTTGLSTSSASLTTEDTWTWLTVTRPITAATPTYIMCRLQISASGAIGEIWGVKVVLGSYCPQSTRSPNLLQENNGPVLYPTLTLDGKYSGITETGTAGDTLVFGRLCYLSTEPRWELADATTESVASSSKLGICVLAAAANGDPTVILLWGKVRAATFPAFSVEGQPVYMSTTAGDVQEAKPVAAGNVARIVGFINTAEDLFFCPEEYAKPNKNAVEHWQDVLVAAATAIRSNEDLSEATPNTFTLSAQPDIPRTLTWAFDSHAQITAYTVVFTGTNAKGITVTDTITEASGWSGETANAYGTITSIIMTARTGTGAGDTMDVGSGSKLGLANHIAAVGSLYKAKQNNANLVLTKAVAETTYDTVDFATGGGSIGAADDLTVWYRY